MNQAPELSTLTFTAPDQRRFDHPLEPLTEREVQQSVELLRSMADWTPNTRIISITLKEPSKSAVYAWPSAPVSERLASAVIMHNARNRAATVTLDLEADRVVSVQLAPEGAQPTLSVDEQIECEQAVLASEEFTTAMTIRIAANDLPDRSAFCGPILQITAMPGRLRVSGPSSI